MKILGILVIVLLLFKCGGNSVPSSGNVAGTDIPTTDSRFNEHQNILINKGLDITLDNARASGYISLPKSFFQINMAGEPCVLYNGVYVMQVQANDYDGSIYDKHNSKGELPLSQQTDFNKYVKDGKGIVYSAETANKNNVITVCPNEEGLQLAVQYASEHVVVQTLDPNYDAITRVHNTIPHPILPKRR